MIYWKGLIQVKNFNEGSQFWKLNFRFEVWIYLVSNVIQKMHDGFKMNESVWMVEYEQQYVNNYQNIWKRPQIPMVRWKSIFLLHFSFILTHLMIAVPFLKAQAIMLRLLCFSSKHFLHCQHNRHIRVAIYTNSLILVYRTCLKCLSHRECHPPYDRSKSTDANNKQVW